LDSALDSALGASAGRGFGSGTASAARRGFFGRLSPNKPLQGPGGHAPAFAAAAGLDWAQRHSRAMAVTIAAAVRRKLPQAHFRLAFSALKFMAIPNKSGKRQHILEERPYAWIDARLAFALSPDYRARR
jgi:hypothetical protein